MKLATSFVAVFLLKSLLNSNVVRARFVNFSFKFKVSFDILVHSDASIGEVAFSDVSSEILWLVFVLILLFLINRRVIYTSVFFEEFKLLLH